MARPILNFRDPDSRDARRPRESPGGPADQIRLSRPRPPELQDQVQVAATASAQPLGDAGTPARRGAGPRGGGNASGRLPAGGRIITKPPPSLAPRGAARARLPMRRAGPLLQRAPLPAAPGWSLAAGSSVPRDSLAGESVAA